LLCKNKELKMMALSAFNRMEQLSGLSAASPHLACGRGCGLSASIPQRFSFRINNRQDSTLLLKMGTSKMGEWLHYFKTGLEILLSCKSIDDDRSVTRWAEG
jgi:hypothetical protein